MGRPTISLPSGDFRAAGDLLGQAVMMYLMFGGAGGAGGAGGGAGGMGGMGGMGPGGGPGGGMPMPMALSMLKANRTGISGNPDPSDPYGLRRS